jgi:hypothetical protein
MTHKEIDEGMKQIGQDLGVKFDYSQMLKDVKNDEYLKNLYKKTDCNYAKLQIYRVWRNDKDKVNTSKPINKFINQTFHIEHDYIYQLNPFDFQLIPQYVIDECDKEIGGF